MFKFFAKRYVIGLVNNCLSNLKDKAKVQVWKDRISKILAFCQSLMQKLDDNEITSEEADQVVQEVKEFFA